MATNKPVIKTVIPNTSNKSKPTTPSGQNRNPTRINNGVTSAVMPKIPPVKPGK